MLTVVCETPGTLRAHDRPMPTPAPHEVLLRVKRVGVCGTDLHIFTGKQPYLSYPRVMGHELSGVVETAPTGSALKSGDTVYVMPYLSCGTCIACRAGKTNCCTRIQVLGVHTDGAFTERLSVHPSQYGILDMEDFKKALDALPADQREAIVLIKASFVVIAPGDDPPAVSVRNCLHGVVRRCEKTAVSAEVVLDIGGGKTLAATITASSAETLGLVPGKPACALFDAAHVIVAID